MRVRRCRNWLGNRRCSWQLAGSSHLTTLASLGSSVAARRLHLRGAYGATRLHRRRQHISLDRGLYLAKRCHSAAITPDLEIRSAWGPVGGSTAKLCCVVDAVRVPRSRQGSNAPCELCGEGAAWRCGGGGKARGAGVGEGERRQRQQVRWRWGLFRSGVRTQSPMRRPVRSRPMRTPSWCR